MLERIKKFVISALGVSIYLGFFGLLILYASSQNSDSPDSFKNNSVVCEIEPIEYETTEGYTDGLEVGDSEVVGGEEGEREICTDDGVEVSNTVVKEPVTETTRYGTYEPEVDYSVRTGALCADGSYSSATGRGACSWHGGVDEWLYD